MAVMKRIIFFVLIGFMVSSFTSSEGPKWYSWNEGYELAVKEQKPMVVFVHATWCHLCKRLDEKTFGNAEVAELMQKDYIPVKFDIESEEEYIMDGRTMKGSQILDEISSNPVRGIPTTLFFKPGGKKAVPVVGLKDPEEMKSILGENLK